MRKYGQTIVHIEHRAGIGALYVRRRPRVRVEALQSGGGQERGMRSGTVPTPLVVGLGAACELCLTEMKVRVFRIVVSCLVTIYSYFLGLLIYSMTITI